jgi:antitoxin HigA-1
MVMHNPPHPGGIVRRQCLKPLDLSVTKAAKGLGVTRQALSDLVNGKAGVSVDMAIRLSKAFGARRLGSACKWLMIFGRRASADARSRFGISKPPSDFTVCPGAHGT